MRQPRITIEQILWALVLVLALGVRLLGIGARPLSDSESTWALQALSLFPAGTNVEPQAPGPQPAYIGLTGLLFSILGSSNALARLLPLLAGILLCLVPYYFRYKIGRPAALIMAAGMALDPGLVALSRLAGSPMTAVGLGLFGLGLLVGGYTIAAGIFLGLALLSGPSAIQGIVILALVWILVHLFQRSGWLGAAEADTEVVDRQTLKPLGLSTLGTILLAGSLFGIFPQGLGAWIGALPAYLQGWVTVSGVPAARMLLVLLVYQPAALIFGLIGLVRGWQKNAAPAQWLSIWLVAALVLVLINPARQMADLVWVLVPLWGLAAILLADYLPVEKTQRAIAAIQAAVVIVLLSLFWLNLAGLTQPVPSESAGLLRWLVMAGILVMIALSTGLVGFGWSWDTAVRGLTWGLVLSLSVYGTAGMWAASQSAANRTAIWDPAPLAGQAVLFQQTLDGLSTWSTGRKETIEIVASVDAPSLRWLLRTFPNASFIPERQEFSRQESVPVVITRKSEQDPSLAANYRGQDFAWWYNPIWLGALPASLPRWLAYHEVPVSQDEIILWARADLFPGVVLEQNTEIAPPIEQVDQGEDLPQ